MCRRGACIAPPTAVHNFVGFTGSGTHEGMAGVKVVNDEAGWQLSNPLFFLTKEIELMCKAAEERAAGGRQEFDRAGRKKGLQIWRIEMARSKPWDIRKYGKFHRGDSYVVLNCYPGENGIKLMYDLHFWSASRLLLTHSPRNPTHQVPYGKARRSEAGRLNFPCSNHLVQLALSHRRMSTAPLLSRRQRLTPSYGRLESVATRIVR